MILNLRNISWRSFWHPFKKWTGRLLVLFALFNVFQIFYYDGRLQKVDGVFLKINSLTSGVINLESFMNKLDYYRPLVRYLHPVKDKLVVDLSKNDYVYFMNFINESKRRGYYADDLKKWRLAKIIRNGDTIAVKLKIQGTNVYGGTIIPFKVKFIGDSVRFNLELKNADATELLPNWLAKRSGLIAPIEDLKYVTVKGHYKFLYMYEEEVSKQVLERDYFITNYSILKNNDDWNRKDKLMGSQHNSDIDDYFGNVEAKGTSLRHDIAIGKFNEMVSLFKKQNVAGLSDLFDKEYMGRFFAVFSLFNDPHFIDGDNFKLLYNHSNGHFYPIYRQEHGFRMPRPSPWPYFNSIAFESMDNFNLGYDRAFSLQLLKALLSDDKIRFYRDKYLWHLSKNKAVFLAAVDSFYDAHQEAIGYSRIPRRTLDRNKRFQRSIIAQSLSKFTRYIHYSKIYLTHIPGNDSLIVMNESFAPIDLYYRKGRTEIVHFNVPPVAFTEKLAYSYRTVRYYLKDSLIRKENFFAVNSITHDTIPVLDIYLNAITFIDDHDDFENVLKRNKINYSIEGDTLTVFGNNILKEQLILPKGVDLKLLPGTQIQLGKGISWLVKGGIYADGSKSPIYIENIPNERFGTFAVIGNGSKEKTPMIINNFFIKGGNEAVVDGVYFSTQFGLYNGIVSLNNVSVSDSKGDDGINIKNSTIHIDNLTIFGNYADQMDLDFCIGKISNSHFKSGREDSNGDGLDMSGAKVIVENSSFSSFMDKGISVGEKSITLIRNCDFSGNIRGMAIKDNSTAFIQKNTFHDNDTNFVMYIKKPIFKKPVLNGIENEISKMYIRQGEVNRYTDPAKLDASIRIFFPSK